MEEEEEEERAVGVSRLQTDYLPQLSLKFCFVSWLFFFLFLTFGVVTKFLTLTIAMTDPREEFNGNI